jgi:hypothetical protein
MFSGQRPQQRGLHDPMQLMEPADIDCQQIVLNEATVFGLIAIDDGEIIILNQFVAVCGHSFVHVSGTP